MFYSNHQRDSPTSEQGRTVVRNIGPLFHHAERSVAPCVDDFRVDKVFALVAVYRAGQTVDGCVESQLGTLWCGGDVQNMCPDAFACSPG
jgi:hypothetical protein